MGASVDSGVRDLYVITASLTSSKPRVDHAFTRERAALSVSPYKITIPEEIVAPTRPIAASCRHYVDLARLATMAGVRLAAELGIARVDPSDDPCAFRVARFGSIADRKLSRDR